ncbi:hypothetical protein GCM10011344_41160 [Dokdonia pacifica]|uniref:Uncharacterized protein n=1 Tax=Dokdonia pacifica TaxID=1627892 RepID=A0A239ADG6_9FLAO|nr:hypothetical protein [Dokdonia pacifica]GGG36040.1 hypothetical protein GCM10011344_41160 [Dokdonia pacifica]SNR92943.1 hypothetical protein SAMN06265376_104302 [Dokdonia pacifica]
MNTTRYIGLGQNRIDYIVYHNIAEAQKLLYDAGFESPESPDDLVEAIKELVRKQGRTVIEALLKIHPDKKAILSIEGVSKVCENCKTKLSDTKKSGCGSCKKAATLKEDDFISDPDSLEPSARLQVLIGKHKGTSNKGELEKEIEQLWNSLRTTSPKQPLAEETIPTNYNLLTKKELCVYASIFGIGVLMGWGFSYSKNS